jgi:DNA-binding transcriptional ArsR family regulator
MKRAPLTAEVLRMIAERFKALSEPARLQLLSAMQSRELSVNELVEETGLGQANVSKHLQVLHALGFVKRRKEGLFVYYALADRTVLKLCDLMCGRIEAQLEAQQRMLGA